MACFYYITDPVNNIINGLVVPRSRNKVLAKLLEIGVIQDKKELRKRRKRSRRNDTAIIDDEELSTEDISLRHDQIADEHMGKTLQAKHVCYKTKQFFDFLKSSLQLKTGT